ncbi:MAG TPA: hypothetical protein VJB98_02745 [Candidatus Paceibacterota bacterium]
MGGFLLFTVQLLEHRIRPRSGQRNFFEVLTHLRGEQFFANIRLGAYAMLLGTAIIHVTFLQLTCDGTTARAALEETAKDMLLLASLGRVSFATHSITALIKKFLCNRWLVLSLIHLAVKDKHAIVKRIFEDHLDVGEGKHFAASANQASGRNKSANLFQRM